MLEGYNILVHQIKTEFLCGALFTFSAFISISEREREREGERERELGTWLIQSDSLFLWPVVLLVMTTV